ncbi:helix-turn-helix domain-containing protein [Leptospira kmetyi]|uniref:HTH araC/xylS-type domain-containing protein n=1 Tax=Leptospira kmetyi TaxID=408139 RepID=A0ABX4NIE2_9LEPT|nr:AraC family transcriptional regulator [Leptospira kmetyi]PJZ31295.1 hypothetical protein CH378_03605 [Leptospira kmetyi]
MFGYSDTISGLNQFSQIVALISFGVSFFLSILLQIHSEENATARLLGGVLAIFSCAFLTRYVLIAGSILSVYIPFLFFPSVFLFGPLVFFYTRSVLFGEPVARKEWRIHSIAPFLIWIAFLICFIRFPEFRSPETVWSQKGAVASFTNSFLFFGIVHASYFLFLTRRQIRDYERNFEEIYSSDDRSKLVWLKLFLGFNYINLFAYIPIFYLRVFDLWPSLVTPAEGVINLAFVYLTFYYVVRKPEILKIGKTQDPLLFENDSTSDEKYKRQTLSSEERRIFLEKIESYMKENKPHLDDKITLPEFANHLGIPPHHLSMTINIELKRNFFNFISYYRVEEAKRLLVDPTREEQSLLRIGFDSGFQSKAAFNKAFKTETGMTPGAFRTAGKNF